MGNRVVAKNIAERWFGKLRGRPFELRMHCFFRRIVTVRGFKWNSAFLLKEVTDLCSRVELVARSFSMRRAGSILDVTLWRGAPLFLARRSYFCGFELLFLRCGSLLFVVGTSSFCGAGLLFYGCDSYLC